MKKIRTLLILLLAVMLLAACTPQAESNKAPTVVGVKDVQCLVNSTVDFLDGVAALDKEDGDITPNLSITVEPHVDVTSDGFATFEQQGEYTVNYQITDSNGRTAQKRAYVDVVDRETYHSFAMPDGYSVETAGAAKVIFSGMRDNEFVVESQDGEIAEDVRVVRTFSLSADSFVTRKYYFSTQFKSDVAGKVTVFCNGEPTAEIAVQQGDNVLQYSCTCPDSSETSCDVQVELCIGGLGRAKVVVGNTSVRYPQQSGTSVELTPDFNFGSMVSPRIDPANSEGLEGNAWALEDGSGARLEITHAGANNIWAGGMFVNTGVQLKPDTTYEVSFKVQRHSFPLREEGTPDDPADFEVIIQRNQWDELQLHKFTNPENGVLTAEVSVDSNNVGPLWIYVQSATQCNQITITDLHVKEHLEAMGTDNFEIADFTCFNSTADYEFHSELGNITYYVKDFDAKDSNHVVTSPSFWVAGSGANYVVQFRIKATSPIEFVVAGPISDGWDPVLLWQKVTLTANVEQTVSFVCNGKTPQGVVADRLYKLVWQFGSALNTQYHDVTIEISDIRICKRDVELDG